MIRLMGDVRALAWVFSTVALLSSRLSVHSQVYQTNDAIIIEGRSDLSPLTQSPSQDIMLNERACLTRQGNVGYCSTVRSCYPMLSLAQLYTPDMWTMVTDNSCHYGTYGASQIGGVCCVQLVTRDDSDADDQPRSAPHGSIQLVLPLNRYTGQWLRPFHLKTALRGKPSPVAEVASIDTGKHQPAFKQSLTCGTGPIKTLTYDEQRLFGQSEADKNSWPGTVSLRFDGKFLCSGSLIGPTQILTAAHCVDNISWGAVQRLSVELGMHVLNPSDAQMKKPVRRVIIHRAWNRSTKQNDIAIVILASTVDYSRSISPVCLPQIGSSDDEQTIKEASSVGWGTIREGVFFSSTVLQHSTVKVLDNSLCKESYPNLAASMLCAVAPETNTCQSDSGGPLYNRTTPDAPWIQLGIVSHGIGCARPGYPVVYTRVSSFRSWIRYHSRV